MLEAANREARPGRGAARRRGRGGELRERSRPAAAPRHDRAGRRAARTACGGLAFFTILILYGQLLTYGFWVASGVVEEKASRVVEVLLATIRPRELLAGKVIGLGLLGLGQLLLIAAVGRRRSPARRGRSTSTATC